MRNILAIVLLNILLIGCNNISTGASDSASVSTSTNSIFSSNAPTKEYIDKKYPYFRVGVKDFFIDWNATSHLELTVEEKKVYLETLALMRLVVNIPEFEKEIKVNTTKLFLLDVNVNDPSTKYQSKIGQQADKDRLLDIVRNASYDVRYGKRFKQSPAAVAVVGPNFYSYYKIKNLTPGPWIMAPNANLVEWGAKRSQFAGLIFHEHLHNYGFGHVHHYTPTKKNGLYVDAVGKPLDPPPYPEGSPIHCAIPYDFQDAMDKVSASILNGKLTAKYSKNLEELISYYLNEYKDYLITSTVKK